MPLKFNNVRISEVPQLAELVALARATPTGSKVMHDLEAMRTNVHLFEPAEWVRTYGKNDVEGWYDSLANTIRMPTWDPAIAAEPFAPGSIEQAAETLVHEGRHRTQAPTHTSRARIMAAELVLEPWRMAAASARMVALGREPGESGLSAARWGAMMRQLEPEFDAFLMQRRFATELGPRGPHAIEYPRSADANAIVAGVVGDDLYQQGAAGSVQANVNRLKVQAALAGVVALAGFTSYQLVAPSE